MPVHHLATLDGFIVTGSSASLCTWAGSPLTIAPYLSRHLSLTLFVASFLYSSESWSSCLFYSAHTQYIHSFRLSQTSHHFVVCFSSRLFLLFHHLVCFEEWKDEGMSTQSCRLACVQLYPQPGQVSHNAQRVKDLTMK
jgi:hypothetical protein